MDANDLEIEYSWNISINHHKLGEMFIVCGVLYGIDTVTERTTKIRLALDLYQNRLLVSLFNFCSIVLSNLMGDKLIWLVVIESNSDFFLYCNDAVTTDNNRYLVRMNLNYKVKVNKWIFLLGIVWTETLNDEEYFLEH